MANAWQPYVDNLVATGFVAKAAIYGHNGSLWATTAGFSVHGDEVKKILSGLNNQGELQGSGLFLGGQKHFVVKQDEKTIYGKLGTGGVSIYKTTQAVIIATYADKMQPGACNNAVEKIGAYLVGTNY